MPKLRMKTESAFLVSHTFDNLTEKLLLVRHPSVLPHSRPFLICRYHRMSEELKAKCVAAGVKRVVFVRHAQAAPPGTSNDRPRSPAHNRKAQLFRFRHRPRDPFWIVFYILHNPLSCTDTVTRTRSNGTVQFGTRAFVSPRQC